MSMCSASGPAASRDDAWEAGRDEKRQALWLISFRLTARRMPPSNG